MNNINRSLNYLVKEIDSEAGKGYFVIGCFFIVVSIIIFITAFDNEKYKLILISSFITLFINGIIFLSIGKALSLLSDIKTNTKVGNIIEIYKNKDTILEYGNYLYTKSMFEEAEKILTYYISYFPKEAKGFVLRGYIRVNLKSESDYYKRSNFENAKSDWEKAKSLGYEKAQELIDKFIKEEEIKKS
jgi:hypothetical protein